jgi:hypothetical protein
LIDGGFDIDRMMQSLAEGVDQAVKDGYKGLWASGDMSWEFGPRKDFSKLLEYEWRLEEFFRRQPALCGICQYHRDTLPEEAVRDGFLSHRAIFINETLSRLNPRFAWTESFSDQNVIDDPKLGQIIANLCSAQMQTD